MALAGLIGAFMGAVALHADLKGNPSFRQVMQRVRKVSETCFLPMSQHKVLEVSDSLSSWALAMVDHPSTGLGKGTC